MSWSKTFPAVIPPWPAAFAKATSAKSTHPDYGNWLTNGAFVRHCHKLGNVAAAGARHARCGRLSACKEQEGKEHESGEISSTCSARSEGAKRRGRDSSERGRPSYEAASFTFSRLKPDLHRFRTPRRCLPCAEHFGFRPKHVDRQPPSASPKKSSISLTVRTRDNEPSRESQVAKLGRANCSRYTVPASLGATINIG